MEIYNIYQSVLTIYAQLRKGLDSLLGTSEPFLLALGVSLGIVCALFYLQAAGLYMMAKKRDMPKKWLAFIPFANLLYIGKLTGPCEVFGHKMQRAGLYTMIAQIVSALLCFSYMAAEAYLFVECAESAILSETAIQFTGLSRMQTVIFNYYRISEYILSIVTLIYSVLLFILLMGLYRKYYAKGYMLLSWVAIFVPLSRYIVIFVLRNNKAIDYNEYLRKKREAYARRYGNMGMGGFNPYGNNPYGNNPYGNNPYGNNPYGNNQGGYGSPNGNPYGERPKPEEPFSEFGDSHDAGKASSSGDFGASPPQGGGESKGDSDDLFD